jgi:hypothetical protein
LEVSTPSATTVMPRGNGGNFGERGNDTIYTGTPSDGDAMADEVRCGNGHDVVYLDGKDNANHNETGDSCKEIRKGKSSR